jgi:hypothetical protein
MLRGFGSALLLLFVACGSAGDAVCEAGKVDSCPCMGGDTGTQTCASDGSKWGACQCATGDPMESDPSDACAGKQDQQSLISSDRCTAEGWVMYVACDQAILDAGVCTMNPTGVFYCCPPA